MTQPPPVDISKLKSFRDIHSMSQKQPHSSRRKSYDLKEIHFVTSCKHYDVFKKYRIKRISKTSIKGHTFYFQISSKDSDYKQIIYYAKFKSRPLGEFAAIQTSSNVHLSSQQFTAVLLNANKMSDFSLRLNEHYGEEVLSLQFSLNTNDEGKLTPRNVSVFTFGQNSENLPKKLTNVVPIETENGSWEVDLGDGAAISSIKNCTLADETGKPMIYVRKIEDDTLEIESMEQFDDLRIFGIGISAFLCKV